MPRWDRRRVARPLGSRGARASGRARAFGDPRPRGRARGPRPLHRGALAHRRPPRHRGGRASRALPQGGARGRAGRHAPRHRKGRDPRLGPSEARRADPRGVGAHAPAPGGGRANRGQHRQSLPPRPGGARRARALRRNGIPRRTRARGDPDRQPDHVRLRRLPRDDERSPLPGRHVRDGGPARGRGQRGNPVRPAGGPGPGRRARRGTGHRCTTPAAYRARGHSGRRASNVERLCDRAGRSTPPVPLVRNARHRDALGELAGGSCSNCGSYELALVEE